MKSSTAASLIFNSVERFNILSNSNFSDREFCLEKYHTAALANLYFKDRDEPDFDCEFLTGICEVSAEKEN